jgi:hypothetical protein
VWRKSHTCNKTALTAWLTSADRSWHTRTPAKHYQGPKSAHDYIRTVCKHTVYSEPESRLFSVSPRASTALPVVFWSSAAGRPYIHSVCIRVGMAGSAGFSPSGLFQCRWVDGQWTATLGFRLLASGNRFAVGYFSHSQSQTPLDALPFDFLFRDSGGAAGAFLYSRPLGYTWYTVCTEYVHA